MGTIPSVGMVQKNLEKNSALNSLLSNFEGKEATAPSITHDPKQEAQVNVVTPAEPINPQAIADEIATQRYTPPDPVVSDTPKPSEPVVIQEEALSRTDELLGRGKTEPKEALVKQRKALEEKAREAKEAKERAAKLEEELERYRKGEVVPEFVAEKQKEIERLKRFEEIHSLKTSQGYVDKFVKPIEDIRGKLYNLAKEYEYENAESLVDEALNITNRRDINRFLETHFDPLDGQLAKGWITELQDISSKARDAELKAGDMLKELSKESEVIRAQKRQELNTTLSDKANRAWINAHNKIIKENLVMELIPRSDDNEFNETYVNPHVKAAASEYGKFVTKIASKLESPLDDDEMEFLARTALLGHASASASVRANSTAERAQKLIEGSQRTASYYRPPIGSGQVQGQQGPTAPVSREERLDKLVQTGMNNARR